MGGIAKGVVWVRGYWGAVVDDADLKKVLSEALGNNARKADYQVPAGIITRWSGILPDALIAVWQDYGYIELAGGRLQLIDPNALAPIISHIVRNDVDLAGDTHPIAYGDLGEVVVWSERYGIGFLSPVFHTLEMYFIVKPDPPSETEQIVNYLLKVQPGLIERYDLHDKPVHDRLVKMLGPLAPGEIYGVTPAPRFDNVSVEDYVVADVAEWLEAVYTQVRVGLVNWDRIPFDLRDVGDPWPRGMKAAPGRAKK